MPTLAEHQSLKTIHLLAIGESGTGKSGSLAALAIAGYSLWILDYDNGLDVVASALREHYKADPAGLAAALTRVNYKGLRDTIVMDSGIPRIKSPCTAWRGAGKALKEWGIDNFTSKDVVVIDTLTTASSAAFNEAMAIAGRLNQKPQQTDYGWMADSVLLLIQALTDDDSGFHLIVNTHIRFFAGDDESQTSARGLPNAKGQQIPKDIGKFFNTTVLFRTTGSGAGLRRMISTQPQGVIEVKTSNPFGVKPTYPVDNTGLASLFKDILGHGPEEQPK